MTGHVLTYASTGMSLDGHHRMFLQEPRCSSLLVWLLLTGSKRVPHATILLTVEGWLPLVYLNICKCRRGTVKRLGLQVSDGAQR